ncbi:MAG: hydrogen peroxide-inducible genes activator [Gammaproteobacteria bacterium]|nr:hydrogen peroxide-inducible genes activator [Gammaproteobacteria bacterium]MDX5374889.1 hydrogen peroxide-inducible genes activator [Gammaproteobacteria bacterium]
MTLTELRYIVAVARERHFGRAAEACFVSQPTLSMGVKRLEEELGLEIFERSKNEVKLTAAGEEIVTQAQRALEEADRIKEIAEHGKDPLAGPLRFGTIYTIGPYLLPQLIPELHQRAPQMPLLLEENYTAVLAEKLKRGQLDVILISLPFAEPGIRTWPVYDEPFVVLLPSSHPLQEQTVISTEELARQNLLLLGQGHCFRDQVLQVCPECNRSATTEGSMQKTLEGSSLETIRHMVASGMGSTVLPCSAAGADQYSRRLVTIRRFADPAPTRRVALAWRESFHRTAAIRALHAAIQASPLTCVEMLDLPLD